MEGSQQFNPQTMEGSNKKIIIAVIIAVILIVAGVVYLASVREAGVETADEGVVVEEQTGNEPAEISESDEVGRLEDELESTDLGDLDAEFKEIDKDVQDL